MPNCKVTKSFFKELSRMTSKCNNGCDSCIIAEMSERYPGESCTEYMMNHVDEVTEAVQKWSDENPPRTRMDDFFEKHPRADMNSLGSPVACCKSLGYIEICPVINASSKSCSDCWMTPIE